MRLRILHVGAFPFPMHLGSQVYVAGLCRALARRGHHITVASYAHGVGRVEGVRVVRARFGSGDRSGPHQSKPLADLSLVRAVRRHLSRHEVDVVVAHNVEATLVARMALSRRKVPLLYDQHACMAEELPTYVRVPGMRWAGGALDRLAARSADAALALSPRGAELLRRLHPRVYQVPPGVDAADLRGGDAERARRRWRLDDRAWVLYTGNLDAYQDLPVLYAAMRRLPERIGLLVVTGDDREVQAGLDPERIRVVRTREFSDTRDAIAVAGVAALPRMSCAGFPMKLLNLLGAGRVTVVARGSAIDAPGAVVVENGDSADLADAVSRTLGDPIGTRSLGQRACEAVARDWSWDVRVLAFERVYLDLVG